MGNWIGEYPRRETGMRETVIVSTARTGIGKAYRGALNATRSPTLMAHALGPVFS